MIDFIDQDARDKVLQDHPAWQRGKGSGWRARMQRVKEGETLVLYPEDDTRSHGLAVTAYRYAKQLGITVQTRKIEIDGQLKLFVWLA